MDQDSGAGLLHRLTSYRPDREWDVPVDDPRVRHDLVPSDPATRPPQLKTYPDDLPRTPLPTGWARPAVPATDVLAGTYPAAAAPSDLVDLAALARVLFLGAGVVRFVERDGGRMLFRAAGSAGGRFPLEVYVSAVGVDGLADGVHHYDAAAHVLVRVGPPASGAATTLVVTGVPWRTGWRYAERGWRHLYWDAGTVLAQLQAAAAGAGLAPRLRTLFPDAAVRDLVGADGVHEYPLALLSLGDGVPAVVAGGPAAAGDLPAVEHPLCTAAQRAGERDALGDPWPDGPAVDLPLPAVPDGAWPGGPPTLDEVVLRRGSARRLDPARPLPRAHLEWSTAVALRGVDVPHRVVAHAVGGVAPGVHRLPDLDRPVRGGDLRAELYELALQQGLAGDAAYVVVGVADPDALDDRTYRDAQLGAGIVGGRLHLAAYALGTAASGMTFHDETLGDVLGEEGVIGLLLTCVGVPEYRNADGGGPGAPVAVRLVASRTG